MRGRQQDPAGHQAHMDNLLVLDFETMHTHCRALLDLGPTDLDAALSHLAGLFGIAAALRAAKRRKASQDTA